MELEYKDIIILVQFVVIALLAFGAYKSVPPDFVRMVLAFAKDQAAKTPSTLDDMAVSEAGKLVDKLLPANPETTVTATVAKTTSAG